MTNRQNTIPRTLRCGTACAKVTLIAALFIPGYLTLQQLSRPAKGPRIEAAKPKPKELVKIYSIVRAHRPDISDAETWSVSEVILEQSAKHSFDPMLVLAMIRVESGFQYTAVSPSGARGIMQILPDVAKALLEEISPAQDVKSRQFKPEYLDDPILNIKLGVYYLHDLKKSFRNLNLALIENDTGTTEIRNRLENKIELSGEYITAVLNAYQDYKKATHQTF